MTNLIILKDDWDDISVYLWVKIGLSGGNAGEIPPHNVYLLADSGCGFIKLLENFRGHLDIQHFKDHL